MASFEMPSGGRTQVSIPKSEDFAATLRPLTQASSLPPACYVSQEFFDLEVERIFMREWLCVGRGDQVEKPGDYFTITLMGEPLVVTRDEQGEIQVLSTVCRHRGAEVVEGQGNRKSFQCRYHLWTYSLRGELIGAPEMQHSENFDHSQVRLPALRVETWEGYIFVNFDLHARPLGPRLAVVSEKIKNYKAGEMRTFVRAEYDCHWNWKLMMDNFMEFYHVMGLHKGVHDPMPAHLSDVEDYNGIYEHSWGIIPEPDGTFLNVTGKHSPLPPIEQLTSAERQMGQFFLIYPSLLFFLTPDAMGYYRVLPLGPDRIHLRLHLCVPPSTVSAFNFEGRLQVATDCLITINNQDMWACRSMQRGFSSQMAEQGRFSKWDKPCHQIARYVIDHVLDGRLPNI